MNVSSCILPNCIKIIFALEKLKYNTTRKTISQKRTYDSLNQLFENS
jgi:hypothetical protein